MVALLFFWLRLSEAKPRWVLRGSKTGPPKKARGTTKVTKDTKGKKLSRRRDQHRRDGLLERSLRRRVAAQELKHQQPVAERQLAMMGRPLIEQNAVLIGARADERQGRRCDAPATFTFSTSTTQFSARCGSAVLSRSSGSSAVLGADQAAADRQLVQLREVVAERKPVQAVVGRAERLEAPQKLRPVRTNGFRVP